MLNFMFVRFFIKGIVTYFSTQLSNKASLFNLHTDICYEVFGTLLVMLVHFRVIDVILSRNPSTVPL